MKIETDIQALENEIAEKAAIKPTNIGVVMQHIKYFLEHLDYLLLQQIDPIKKANFFGLLFNKTPTYAEIESGINLKSEIAGLNELFRFKNMNKSLVVHPKGFEPLITVPKTVVISISPRVRGRTELYYSTISVKIPVWLLEI